MSTVPEWERQLHTTVYAHLSGHIELSQKPCGAGDVMLRVRGSNAVEIVLFSDRACLVLLRDVVADALATLAANGPTDSTAAPAA